MDRPQQTAAPSPAADQAASHPLDAQREVSYDEEPVRRLLERCIKDAQGNEARLDRDRQDWLNLLFYRGGQDNQWVVWDNGTNSYVTRGHDPEVGGIPEHVHRAVTNIFARTIDGVSSLLNQADPSKEWYPRTEDDADRAAAEVAEDADQTLLEEIGYKRIRLEMHKQITLTDKTLLCLWYDNDPKYGYQGIPLLECTQCGTVTTPIDAAESEANRESQDRDELSCPECGGELVQRIGMDGAPEQTYYEKGRMRADLLPSFEFSIPPSAKDSNSDDPSVSWILTHSAMSESDIISRWGDKGKAALQGGRQTSGPAGQQRHYAAGMRRLSSPSSARMTGMGGGAAREDGHLVYRIQHDPVEDEEAYFPQGLYACMIGSEIVDAGPLPCTDDQGQPRKSWLIRSFQKTPGTGFGKPPGDDLVPLQTTRNVIETLIALILMHDAAPRTFIPLTVSLETEPSGVPGENVYYRSTVPGEVPFSEPGRNPPAGLYEYLNILDQKFQEVSGLNAVLLGQRPEGDPTLGEVEILQERGMSAFKEPFECLVDFEKRLSKTLLWIARRSLWTDRFHQVRGENSEWEVRQFMAADLAGNIDVDINPQSAWPKSPVMQMLRTQKAIEIGALPPPAMDPELSQKLLGEMGLSHLKPSHDVARKQVARQIDAWKNAQSPQQIGQPAPFWDLQIHFQHKSRFLWTEEAEQMAQERPEVYNAIVQHVMMIQMMLMPPPGPAGPGGEAAGEEEPQGEGLGSLLSSGVVVPEEGDASTDTGELVEAGVLSAEEGGSAQAETSA